MRTSQGLDQRRRRILYRAWHRGTREMDLILGRFADECLASMNDKDLTAFEELMETPDQQLFSWINGTAAIPAGHESKMLQTIIARQGGFAQK